MPGSDRFARRHCDGPILHFSLGKLRFADFNRDERFRPRHVIPFPIAGSAPAKEAIREEQTYAVLNRLGTLAKKPDRWFGCCCIAIEPEDGMTWSAESVAQKLGTEYPGFDILRLARKTASNSLPHITQILGQRQVMKAAVRNQLAEWYPTLNVAYGVAVVAGVLLLGVITAVGEKTVVVRE